MATLILFSREFQCDIISGLFLVNRHYLLVYVIMAHIDICQQIMPNRVLLTKIPFNDTLDPIVTVKELHSSFVQIMIGLCNGQYHRDGQLIGMINQTQITIFHSDITIFNIKYHMYTPYFLTGLYTSASFGWRPQQRLPSGQNGYLGFASQDGTIQAASSGQTVATCSFIMVNMDRISL